MSMRAGTVVGVVLLAAVTACGSRSDLAVPAADAQPDRPAVLGSVAPAAPDLPTASDPTPDRAPSQAPQPTPDATPSRAPRTAPPSPDVSAETSPAEALPALPVALAPLTPVVGLPTRGRTPRAHQPSPEQVTNGVSLTLVLDRAAARVGEVVVGTLTVRNGGSKVLTVGLGCDGTAPGLWTVSQGIGPFASQVSTGTAGDFRERAAGSRLRVAPDQFAPCPRGHDRARVAPGQSLSGSFRWTATTINGSLYDGDVVVSADTPFAVTGGPLGALEAPEVALRVTGGDPRRIAPVQALDRALADPDFGSRVAASDRGAARRAVAVEEPVVFGQLAGGDYRISFTPDSRDGLGSFFTATVSAGDGQVLMSGGGSAMA